MHKPHDQLARQDDSVNLRRKTMRQRKPHSQVDRVMSNLFFLPLFLCCVPFTLSSRYLCDRRSILLTAAFTWESECFWLKASIDHHSRDYCVSIFPLTHFLFFTQGTGHADKRAGTQRGRRRREGGEGRRERRRKKARKLTLEQVTHGALSDARLFISFAFERVSWWMLQQFVRSRATPRSLRDDSDSENIVQWDTHTDPA